MSTYRNRITEKRQPISEVMDEAAETLLTYPPADWAGWIVYLLEAMDNGTPEEQFSEVLDNLLTTVEYRFNEGAW